MYNYDTPDPKGYAAFPFSERGVHPMKPEAAWGDLQRQFWNRWNSTYREREVSNVSLRQAEVVTGWLERLNRRDLTILEVGCGSAWFCPQLTRYGAVTGTDLSDEVLERARERVPAARFVSGDFMELAFEDGSYDVVVALEVLSHVADQRTFVQ